MKPDSSNICTNILYVKKEKEKKKKGRHHDIF